MDMTSPFDATHTIPVRLVLNADTTWTQSRRSIQEGILHGAINDTLSQMPTSIAKGTNLYIRTAITSTSLQAKLVNVRAPENI